MITKTGIYETQVGFQVHIFSINAEKSQAEGKFLSGSFARYRGLWNLAGLYILPNERGRCNLKSFLRDVGADEKPQAVPDRVPTKTAGMEENPKGIPQ